MVQADDFFKSDEHDIVGSINGTSYSIYRVSHWNTSSQDGIILDIVDPVSNYRAYTSYEKGMNNLGCWILNQYLQ